MEVVVAQRGLLYRVECERACACANAHARARARAHPRLWAAVAIAVIISAAWFPLGWVELGV